MRAVFRLLFIGDVVGERGVTAVRKLVPGLRRELGLDAVIANGENSAEGRGVTAGTGEALLSVVDFLTLGEHAFDQEGVGPFLERERRIVRPANSRDGLPGRGWGTFEANGARVGVVAVQGRVFMDTSISSPFEVVDRAVEELGAQGADLILVDVHAEATGEKQTMGWHLDGRVAAVVGTHTHVPTADLRVLPGGTAYATDVGMAGDVDGIIGVDRETFIEIFFEEENISTGPARGPVRLDAVLVEVEPGSGRAASIERVFREWSG